MKCQETGKLLKWEQLNVDHRQPNTFSIIVDRFVGLGNIVGDNDMRRRYVEMSTKKCTAQERQ